MAKLKILFFSTIIGLTATAVIAVAFTGPGSNQPPNGNPTFWTLNGTNMYYNGGNVGIGTSTPSQKLDVNGYVKGTGLCIGSDCKTTWSVTETDPTIYAWAKAAVKPTYSISEITGQDYQAGSTLLHSNTGTNSSSACSWTRLKETQVAKAGSYRITYNAGPSCCWGYFAVFKNGTQVGPTHYTTASDNWWTDDVSGWNAGDSVQIYGYGGCAGCGCYEWGSELDLYINDTSKPVSIY